MITEVRRMAFRPAELAATLGTSRPTIDRWIAQGVIRSFVVGRQRFIAADEVERLIREAQEQ